ncbi:MULTISPECIES: hypothetical protein [Flavobacterium]|uniref:Uncharacterized protein n=1 Tax=Flavobacterium pectinovorum TaxID=29533 RepID=A0AB36P6F2_9FLAO|nr:MULTISPECIES: hypothetical protein [Flavobacterium]MRX38401.1 hypothetical protein [Flavobacterium sp. LC2016-23]OXB07805.1 hypothetical protein B0A72_02765 [Flavobacterium pectinovorum]SHM81073.1 hypothetical protein SAMN05444387_3258 [Flavobacterium pectinovorum]
MANNLTLDKTLDFFRAFKGDEITFETSHCGNYTDLHSEIHGVGPTSLRVKVNPSYINPDCVDKDNMMDVSIDSIRTVLSKNTPIELYEIDGKIETLRGFILKNKMYFTPSEQMALENLLRKMELFYSEVLLEGNIDSEEEEKEIERNRFKSLFLNL